MPVDGLRRKRLELLSKKKIEMRHQKIREHKRLQEKSEQGDASDSEEQQIDKEIGLLKCARKDLI